MISVKTTSTNLAMLSLTLFILVKPSAHLENPDRMLLSMVPPPTIWDPFHAKLLAVEIVLMMFVYIMVYFLDLCKGWNVLFDSFNNLKILRKPQSKFSSHRQIELENINSNPEGGILAILSEWSIKIGCSRVLISKI